MNLDHNLLVSDVMRNSVAGQIEALKSLEARINDCHYR